MKNIYSNYIKSPFTGKKNSIKGVVIHNDAGSMTPSQYLPWLNGRVRSGQINLGFASLYINRNEALWFSPTDHAEWHTATPSGNWNYIGFEVCESMSVNNTNFLANEEATLKIAADVMKSYNLTPNRSTVMLHNEFVPTACPHRSWEIHIGKGAPYNQANKNKLKDHFIKRIKHYMGAGTVSKPTSKPANKPASRPTAKPKPQKKGRYETGWHWSGTFTVTAKEGIAVYRAEPRIKAKNLVNKASFLADNSWVNFDHIFLKDGYWWIRFKYAAAEASTNYFFAPIGKKKNGIGFASANKRKELWGTVTKLNTNESKSGVTNWKKYQAVK